MEDKMIDDLVEALKTLDGAEAVRFPTMLRYARRGEAVRFATMLRAALPHLGTDTYYSIGIRERNKA